MNCKKSDTSSFAQGGKRHDAWPDRGPDGVEPADIPIDSRKF
jgi:hypothetical protein